MPPFTHGSYEFDATSIAVLRNRLNLKQTQMAELIGVPSSTVSRWESGAANPDAKSLAAIYSLAMENGEGVNFFKMRATPPNQQTKKPAPPPNQQAKKPASPPNQQAKKPASPPNQQAKKPASPPNQQAKKPASPPNQQAKKPAPPPNQQTKKPAPPPNTPNKLSRVAVLADFQNLGVSAQDISNFNEHVRNAVNRLFPNPKHTLFRAFISPNQAGQELRHNGWRVKEGSDNWDASIIQQARAYCGADLKGTALILITKDGDFTDLVKDLQGKGVTVYLMAPANPSRKLLDRVAKERRIAWPDQLGQPGSAKPKGPTRK